MVKLDVTCMRHLTKSDFRVLTAVEMGMKNHDIVPVELITSIAKLRHGGSHKILSTLLTFKLIAHDRTTYDGYRLTFTGYDILALHVLLSRGHIAAVGTKIGVGKESDIYIAQTEDGEEVVLKFHRLGRTSFKAVKNKRDYLKGRTSTSWLYMARLSALKEFAFMKALHDNGFPTPTPIDHNRHVVLMTLAKGFPMYQLRSGEMANPDQVFRFCAGLVTRMAQHGLIHCDLNEFNLLVDPEERVTLIDFPQMVSTRHPNARDMFDRDVNCLLKYFRMKMKYNPPEEDVPSFDAIIEDSSNRERLDESVQASGFGHQEAEALSEFVDNHLPQEHEVLDDEDDAPGSEGEGSARDSSDDELQGGLLAGEAEAPAGKSAVESDGEPSSTLAEGAAAVSPRAAGGEARCSTCEGSSGGGGEHSCEAHRDCQGSGAGSGSGSEGSEGSAASEGEAEAVGGTAGAAGRGAAGAGQQPRWNRAFQGKHAKESKKSSRNFQKRKVKGKILYKNQDF